MSSADRKRKGADSDDDFDSDIGDDDINEELALPPVLAGISNAEKRELYRFKRAHNERDWEEEILRRSDLLARKIDMERLKSMSKKGGATAAAPAPATKATKGKRKAQSSEDEASEQSEEEEEEVAPARGSRRKPTPAPQPAAGQARRVKMISLQSDSEVEEKGKESEEEEEDEESEAEDESEDDDDLFDSDEEEEISKRVLDDGEDGASGPPEGWTGGRGKAGKKVLGKKGKKAAVSTRSTRSSGRGGSVKRGRDSGSEDGEESEDEEDEEEELYGRRLSAKKGGKTSQFGYEEDGEDVNLSRIKEKNKSSSRAKGYDSDEGGKGGRGASGGAKKALSVQDQMKADLAALMVHDDSPLATVEDYWTIQPRRTEMIMKWLHEPFLKNALEGFYVRFAIGDVNNKAICRMCKVVGVDLNGKMYKLAETGETCTVRLSLMVAGVVRKNNRVCQVSNSRITPDEFKFYFDCAEKARVEGKESDKLLTKNQVRAMRKLFLSHTVQHVYTDQEIKDMVKKSIGLDKSKVTEYSTALESLQKRQALARENKDFEALEVVQKTIEAVQRRFADEKEKFDKAASRSMAVNRRMKESNVQRDMAAGNRLRAENLEAAAKGVQSKAEADPFSRRETRPKILWNTGKRLEDARLPEGTAPTAAAAESTAAASTADVTSTTSNKENREVHGKPLWKVIEPPSLEQIRRRVKQRLGVDPVQEAARSVRERYLSRVCARLPPLYSEERAQLRLSLDAKSLEDALEGMEAAEGDMEVVA
eukprot:CAMPEP_0184971838 /NCGR_PEP_ID=MMETSP1098-20130426/3987_1 /TAXON_ID=89044 /ORGANISM="Spumella elongata, Strain CCAP 955/1" /LENGTH=763 /DNA_ID=CAMNT_0027494033 /DNA_START=71 /DNA_END=2362 /DNA_ORIENTATION=-